MKRNLYPWKGFGLFIFLIVILSGLFYIYLQLSLKSAIQDPLFIGILMANTFAIFRFSAYFKTKLNLATQQFVQDVNLQKINFDSHKMVEDIFDIKSSLIIGLVFSTLFFLGSLSLTSWEENTDLKYSLVIFLSLVNFLTGMALRSMLIYFKYSLSIGNHIEVKLWNRSNLSLNVFQELNKFVLYATAFISSMGMISILFSEFQLDFSIVVFSIFSVSIILVAYIIPLIPITEKLQRLKAIELEKVGDLIEEEYKSLINQAHGNEERFDKSRFEDLIEIEKSIKAKRTFPPIGENTINTAFILTLITMTPTLIDTISKLSN